MQLHYKVSGTGPPLIILHGLFGMLDNWQTVARALENNFTVYLIDQRNHGKSPHIATHTYPEMAADLASFFSQHSISSAYVTGHSMGGKTAMQFALDYPEKVKKIIVVDMGVKRYPGGHDAIFDALQSFDPGHISTRSEAEKMLMHRIPDQGTRQFVLKNLTREQDGTYHWKFNLPALTENYISGILAPVTGSPSAIPALFIRGENSNYIPDSDWNGIQKLFPVSALVTISGAGHWVHADRPLQLINEISLFLQADLFNFR